MSKKLVKSKSFPCSLCEKDFSVKSNLTRHFLTTHQNNNHSFTCDQCDRRFHRKDSLIRHVKSHQKKKRCQKVLNLNPDNKCPICLLTFPSRHGLLHHSRAEHEPIINDGSYKEYFECSKCSVRVTNKRDMIRHFHTVHSFDNQDKLMKKVPSFRCAECGKEFHYRKTILDHYKEEHQIELELKHLQFDKIDDFEKWKSSCYTMTNVWKTSLYDVKRFRCHRSGVYRDDCRKANRKRQRHLKIAGSKKIQAMCPSEITLRQRHEGGSCFVTHQKTHVGHSIDDLDELKHIFLKKDDKRNIARLLKAGIPKETILRNIYCDYNPNDDQYQPIVTLPHLEDDGEFRLDRDDLEKVLPKVSKRLRRLRQRHATVEEYAAKEPATVECIDEDVWQVGFSAEAQGIVEMFVVQKCEKECSAQTGDCELFCQSCETCFHEYQCLCQDYSASQNMCVHVHALCQFLLNQATTDEVTLIGSDEVPNVSEDLIGSLQILKSSQIASKTMPRGENDLERNFEETLHSVLQNPSESIKLVSSFGSDEEEMEFEEIIDVAPEKS